MRPEQGFNPRANLWLPGTGCIKKGRPLRGSQRRCGFEDFFSVSMI
jgi:hypothetical protein